MPKLVLAPSFAASLIFVYGFMLVTGYMSFTASQMMPRYTFVGLARYRDLFANDVWWESVRNLAWFTVPFIAVSVAIGLMLAILLDQKIRPKACCARSTCIRWRCRSSSPARPGNGSSIPAWARAPGAATRLDPSFKFDWLVDPRHGDLSAS